MARDKYIEGRNEGMAYSLKVAKEQGIEALEKEVRIRGLTNLPTAVPTKAMEEFIRNVKSNVIDTFVILTAATLHDEFGFGQKRVQQFIDRFMAKSECLADDYCSWDDYINTIKEELDITLCIRENNKDVTY